MVEEIKQGDKVVLSSEDGFSVPMIFNNICGKNFSGEEYRNYIKYVVYDSMGLKPALSPIIGTEFYTRAVQSRNSERTLTAQFSPHEKNKEM